MSEDGKTFLRVPYAVARQAAREDIRADLFEYQNGRWDYDDDWTCDDDSCERCAPWWRTDWLEWLATRAS